jgi:hypothetical protein
VGGWGALKELKLAPHLWKQMLLGRREGKSTLALGMEWKLAGLALWWSAHGRTVAASGCLEGTAARQAGQRQWLLGLVLQVSIRGQVVWGAGRGRHLVSRAERARHLQLCDQKTLTTGRECSSRAGRCLPGQGPRASGCLLEPACKQQDHCMPVHRTVQVFKGPACTTLSTGAYV